MKSKNISPKFTAGLTLIELMTSIFIIMIISAVVVYNHRSFTDNLEITNLAFDVALTIREAQISGISVRPVGGAFDYAYGVHFLIRNSSVPANKSDVAFIRFVDITDKFGGNPDSLYNGDFGCTSNECLEKIEIGRGNKISEICYRKKDDGNLKCGNVLKGVPSGVDITFLRPKPDASIRFLNSGGNHMETEDGDDLDDREVVICLESPLGKKKSVHVLYTGQISVQNGEGCVDPPGGGPGSGGGPGGGGFPG